MSLTIKGCLSFGLNYKYQQCTAQRGRSSSSLGGSFIIVCYVMLLSCIQIMAVIYERKCIWWSNLTLYLLNRCLIYIISAAECSIWWKLEFVGFHAVRLQCLWDITVVWSAAGGEFSVLSSSVCAGRWLRDFSSVSQFFTVYKRALINMEGLQGWTLTGQWTIGSKQRSVCVC